MTSMNSILIHQINSQFKSSLLLMFALEVPEETLEVYKKLKMKREYRWIIFKIEDQKQIIVESTGEPTSSFAEFTEKLPKEEPRYAVYDLMVEQSDGRKESKLLLFLYAPDCGETKVKFLYATAKHSLKNKLGSVHREIQVRVE